VFAEFVGDSGEGGLDVVEFGVGVAMGVRDFCGQGVERLRCRRRRRAGHRLDFFSLFSFAAPAG
jgi:hypothetical protein